jgi:hypothetical protein
MQTSVGFLHMQCVQAALLYGSKVLLLLLLP